MKSKIVQIVSASGWFAVFENEGKRFVQPIVCWALLDDGRVAGIVTCGESEPISIAEHEEGFVRYQQTAELT